MDSCLMQIVQTVDDFDLRSAKSIQLGNAKQVSLSQHCQAGTELVPLVDGRGAADLLKEHLLATCCLQFFDL